MIFAIGTPRILTHRLQTNIKEDVAAPTAARSSIIAICKCPGRPLFAAISAASIALWAVRPDNLLAASARSQTTIKEDGENVDVVWKPDGSQLVVLTNEGFLHFYDVVDLDSPLYAFASHHTAAGPGESRAAAKKSLRFRMALEIDSGTQCGVGLDDELLICTNSPPSILSLLWNGQVNFHKTIPLSQLHFLVDQNDPIAQIAIHRSRNIFGLISLEGRAYLATRSSPPQAQTAPPTDVWSGICFYNPSGEEVPATTIAFNPIFTLVAVGTLQGVAVVFRLADMPTDLPPDAALSHVMAITKPGDAKAPIRLSATAALSWTADGSALAVAWVYGGMSVWSVFGSLLMSTVSEDTFVHSSDGIVNNTNELFFTGTQDLFWDDSGHDLFVLPSLLDDQQPISDIYVLQFAKASIRTCDSWSNSRHVCLLLDDRLLMYEGLNSDVDATSLDPLNWETIPIPNVYLSENWPIRYISINPTGTFIAIAGTRGLAHYNTLSAKWKLFGSEYQEQSFAVQGGILWFRTMLIIACQDLITKTSEIRVFSRETKLDNSYILHIERMQHPVLCMNNTDSHLLLYCADHVVRYYSIHVDANGRRLQFHPQQAFSMQDLVVGAGWPEAGVQAIARFPPPGEISIETMCNNPFVILRDGALYMISKRDDAWEAIQIATHTEHFWISTHEDEVEEFSNTMWAFSGANIKILINIIVDPVTGVDHSFLDAALNINVDFYPLTVLIQKGLFVGIEKRISLNASLDVSQFGTDAKSHLFLHFMLRHLLMLGMESKAIKFASNYISLEYFGHALEMLLHRALEEDVDHKRSVSVKTHDSEAGRDGLNAYDDDADTLLSRAVRFVQRFPKSLDIIVNCARKSEMALWAHFFSVVGDPKMMFQASLDAGLLGTATSYLIIIQTLETSLTTSSRLAIRLLEKAFELREYETGSELVRFLRTIDEGEAMTSQSGGPRTPKTAEDVSVGLQRRQSVIGPSSAPLQQTSPLIASAQDASEVDEQIATTHDDAPDMFYFDLLVNNHAKKILSSRQYRDLGRYAVLFQLNLSEWLDRERERTRTLITTSDEYFETLMALHEQFVWAMPNEFSVARRGSIPQEESHDDNQNNSLGRKHRKTSLRTHPTRPYQNRSSFSGLTLNLPPQSGAGQSNAMMAFATVGVLSPPSMRRKMDELLFLYKCARRGRFVELSLLICAMMMDSDRILDMISSAMETNESNNPGSENNNLNAMHLLTCLCESLTRTKCRGYKQLARHLNHVVASWNVASQ